MNFQEVLKVIEKERKRRGINVSNYASMIGIQRSHFYSIKDGKATPNANLMFRMLETLDIDLSIGKAPKADTEKQVLRQASQDGKEITITIKI